MNQFEFISYKPTPADQYMIGVATVRLYGKVILRYKHVKTKDGGGDFFTCPSFSISENGEKKYVQTFMLDPRSDEGQLMQLVRSSVKTILEREQAPIATQDSIFASDHVPVRNSPIQMDMPF